MEKIYSEHLREGVRGGGFERYDWIEKNLPKTPIKILELGCNTGIAAESYAELGHDVIAVDLPQVIKNRMAINPKAKFVGKNFDGPNGKDYLLMKEWVENFDVIICTEVLQHVIFPMNLLYRIYHWLKPGGSLFLTAMKKAYLPNIEHVHYFPVDHLKQMLKTLHFDILETNEERSSTWIRAKTFK